MNRQREEILASALWAFIERVRERGGAVANGLDGLTPAEVEQLGALFRTAADLQTALETDPATGAGAEGRVRAAMAARTHERERGERPARRPLREVAPRLGSFAPRWATTGIAVAALAVGFFAGRVSRSSPRVALAPDEVASTRKLKCREARDLFAVLLQDKLSEDEQRAVLWHCAKCGSCLDAYYAARAQHKHQQHGEATPVGMTARR